MHQTDTDYQMNVRLVFRIFSFYTSTAIAQHCILNQNTFFFQTKYVQRHSFLHTILSMAAVYGVVHLRFTLPNELYFRTNFPYGLWRNRSILLEHLWGIWCWNCKNRKEIWFQQEMLHKTNYVTNQNIFLFSLPVK